MKNRLRKKQIAKTRKQFRNLPGRDITLFKYNQDDILEILIEHLAEFSNYGTYNSRAILLGTVGKDLRLICAVSPLEDREGNLDIRVNELDLELIDKNMGFNGSHSFKSVMQCPQKYCFHWVGEGDIHLPFVFKDIKKAMAIADKAKQITEGYCGCSFGTCTRESNDSSHKDWYESNEPELERDGLNADQFL